MKFKIVKIITLLSIFGGTISVFAVKRVQKQTESLQKQEKAKKNKTSQDKYIHKIFRDVEHLCFSSKECPESQKTTHYKAKSLDFKLNNFSPETNIKIKNIIENEIKKARKEDIVDIKEGVVDIKKLKDKIDKIKYLEVSPYVKLLKELYDKQLEKINTALENFDEISKSDDFKQQYNENRNKNENFKKYKNREQENLKEQLKDTQNILEILKNVKNDKNLQNKIKNIAKNILDEFDL